MAKLTDRTELITPADGDLYVTTDVSDLSDAATGTDKKITWANLKAGFKTYFDTLYAAALGTDDNYVTDAEKTKLSNLSGTNTGDQTITNSSDATSHTVTLSASGGSVQLIEGTNITLTTGGTGSAGTVTIAASGGSGDVTKVGTPANNQVGVWTGDGTLEGDAALTFDTTTDTLTVGSGGNGTITSEGTYTLNVHSGGGLSLDTGDGSDITILDDVRIGTGAAAGALYSSGNFDLILKTGNATTGNITIVDGADGAIQINPNGSGLLDVNATVDISGNIELGNASDTTLSRASAGVLAVEGVNVLTTATGLPLSGGTMTGNITLAENAAIALDPAGSADGKYTGITVAGTAGATLAFGDLCYLDPTDSRWELADANAAAAADGDSRGILGICVLAAAGDGSATTMLLQGIVRADTAFPALTIGAPVYVSETAGDIVVTQPTTTDVVIRIVGVAITADEIFFRPDFTWVTHT